MYTAGFVFFVLVIIVIFGGWGGAIIPCTMAGLSYRTIKQRFMGNNRDISRISYLPLKDCRSTQGLEKTAFVSSFGVPALPRILIASRSCQIAKTVKRHIEAATPRRYEIICVSNEIELAAYNQYRKSMQVFLESNFFYQDTALKLDSLKKQFPAATITVVDCTYIRSGELAWFFLSGLSFISLWATDDEIRDCFRTVLQGRLCFPNGALEAAKELQQGIDHPPHLTTTQIKVMKLRCTGRTIKKVSGVLAICVKTVNNHITVIYEKLGTNSLVRITGYALDHDIVKPWELWSREDVTRGGR